MLSGVRYNYLLKEKLKNLSQHLTELFQSTASRETQESVLKLKKYVDELINFSSLDRKHLERLHLILKEIQEKKEGVENFNFAIAQINHISLMYQIQFSYLQRVEKVHNRLVQEFVRKQDFLNQLIHMQQELTHYESEKDDELISFLKKDPHGRVFSKDTSNREAIEMIGNEKEAIAKAVELISRLLTTFKHDNTILSDALIDFNEQSEKLISKSKDQSLILAIDHLTTSIDRIFSNLEQFKWEENVDIGYYHFMKTGLGKYIAQYGELENLHTKMSQEVAKKKVDYSVAPRKATMFDKKACKIREDLQLIKDALSPDELLRLELFDVRGKSDFDRLMMMMSDKDFDRFLLSFKNTIADEKTHLKSETKREKSSKQTTKEPSANVEDKEYHSRIKKGW